MNPAGPRSSFHDSGSSAAYVAGDGAVLLADEDAVVGRIEHAAEEGRVADARAFGRRKKALRVEVVVRSHEHRAEAAECVEIATFRLPNHHCHRSLLRRSDPDFILPHPALSLECQRSWAASILRAS